jgi:hypothetical protein
LSADRQATAQLERHRNSSFRRGPALPFVKTASHAIDKNPTLRSAGIDHTRIDGSHNRALEIYTAEKAAFPDLLAPPTGAHMTGFVLDSIAYFVGAIVRDAPVLATGEDGIAATRIICAILESAEAGQPVSL